MTGASKDRGDLKPKDRMWIYLFFIAVGMVTLFFLSMGGMLMTDMIQ